MLAVTVMWRDATVQVTSVTYRGQALTPLDVATILSGGFGLMRTFALTRPAVGAGDVVVTWASAVSGVAVAVSVSEALDSAPVVYDLSAASSAPSLSVSSAAGRLLTDVVASYSTATQTVAAGQIAAGITSVSDVTNLIARATSSHRPVTTAEASIMAWTLSASVVWGLHVLEWLPADIGIVADLLTRSHRRWAEAFVLVSGAPAFSAALVITDGTIVIDEEAAVRRRLTATVVDPTGSVGPIASVLQTPGVELDVRVWVSDDEIDESVGVGIYRITQAVVTDDGGDRRIELSGEDRSSVIAAARWEAEYQIQAGFDYVSVIRAILNDRYNGPLDIAGFPSTIWTTPALVFSLGGDPWAQVGELADAIGWDVYFDTAGRVVASPQNVLRSGVATPDLRFVAGESAALAITKTTGALPRYNAWVVTGESTAGPPVQAVALDLDPDSPTYYLGPYGRHPGFKRSELITTADQALEVARAKLARGRSGQAQLAVTAIPNPFIDGGQVALVQRPSIGVDTLAVVQSARLPLGSGTMDIMCRPRRELQ